MKLTSREHGLQHELSLRLHSERVGILEQTQGGLLVITNNAAKLAKADRIAANLDHIASPWRPGETRYFPLRTHPNRWKTQADQWNLRRCHWIPVALHLEAEVDPCHDARIKGKRVMVWNTLQNPDTDPPEWESECENEPDAELRIRDFLLSPQGQHSRRDVILFATRIAWPDLMGKLVAHGYTITTQEKLESENLELEPADWLGTGGRTSQREAENALTRDGFVSVTLLPETGTIVWLPDSPRPGTRDKNRSARTILTGALRQN